MINAAILSDHSANWDAQHDISLPTGTLSLVVDPSSSPGGPDLHDMCDFAARANPKRGFLIVSKVLGRHLPARPAQMRSAMRHLAAALPATLPQPVVFLGMAETATALGQGVFAAYRELNPDIEAIYLQSARQTVEGAHIIARFEEGHSHATSHLIQVRSTELEALVRAARSLVIIDDECSTGSTFVAATRALAGIMPMLERAETCCITDWSGGGYLADMPVRSAARSVLSGRLSWTPGNSIQPPALPAGSNGTGEAPATGMGSRIGLRNPESAIRKPIVAKPGERVLVLGDGEHSYEALLIAEELDAQGAIAAVQSITRTPALLGQAMQTCSQFVNSDGSGAPTYLYNILAHAPERIVIAAERHASQLENAQDAIKALGAVCPVELVLCRYNQETSAC